MRVTVLGGSAAAPGPGIGCSGYLVSQDAANVVLDLGPGTLAELFRHVDDDEIAGIVISHMHQDHFLDLIPLRYRLMYSPKATSKRIGLHLPPAGIQMLDAIAAVLKDDDTDPAAFFRDVFELSEFDPQAGLDIGGVAIRFAPSIHPTPCWMMRVACPGGDLGYTADTGPNPAAASFLHGVRCLLVESTRLAAGPPGTHLSAKQAGQLATDANAEEAVLCHLWSELGRGKYLREARSAFDGSLRLAEPGLTIEWPS